MLRTFALATLALLGTLSMAAPAKADFNLDGIGRMLRNQGFRPTFNNNGFYTIRQGGFNINVFPSRDGSRMIFNTQLAQFNQRDLRAPQFNRLFQLNQFQNFGQFKMQNNNLFFQQQINLRNFQPNQFGFQLNGFAQTLNRPQRDWNPQFWGFR